VLAVVFGGQIRSVSAQPPDGWAHVPNFYRCFDLLRLEKLRINPGTDSVIFDQNDLQLVGQYFAVSGWLQGFHREEYQ